MTVREITKHLIAIKHRQHPNLTPDERTALDNICSILIHLADRLETMEK
jgi:hypothetical protein